MPERLPIAAAGVPAVSVSAGAAGAVATTATTATSAPVLAGVLAVTVVFGGGAAAVLQPTAANVPPLSMHSATQPVATPGAATTPPVANGGTNGGAGRDASAGNDNVSNDPLSDLVSNATDPLNALIPDLPVGPVPEHVAPDGLVGAVVDLDLDGTGMPGATVSAQVADQVYTTVVAANGKWALHLTARPDRVGPITLKQNLKILGVTLPIDIPLALLSDTLGVTVDLLN